MSRLIRNSHAIFVLAGFASLPLVVPAAAQQSSCSSASSTVEMNLCADQNYQAADGALNDAYGVALKYVRARHLEKPYDARSFEDALTRAQRAWVAYRDADCKNLMAEKWAGGTGTTSAVLNCMTSKTLQRTEELKEEFRDQ